MRILQIDNNTHEDIAKVLKYADEHRFTTAMVKLVFLNLFGGNCGLGM